jgi:hypothetical protein
VVLERNLFGKAHARIKENDLGGNGMDVSAFVVLENTLSEISLQPKTLQDDDSRLDECVTVVRACMKLIEMDPVNPDYAEKLLQALLELARIAHRNGEYVMAGRLRTLVYRLSLTAAESQRRARTA